MQTSRTNPLVFEKLRRTNFVEESETPESYSKQDDASVSESEEEVVLTIELPPKSES